MSFNYYVSYGVKTTSGQGLNGLLVRAPVRLKTGEYQFYISEDASKPVFSMQLSAVKSLPRGAVQAIWDTTGETLTFEPLTIPQVKANAEWIGVDPAAAATLRTAGELSLLLHDMVVPDWYDDAYAPVASAGKTESIETPAMVAALLEADFWIVEGQEAEIGSVHFWSSRNRWFKKIEAGLWRMLNPPDEWQDSADLPRSTLQQHLVGGRLTDERKALHDSIIERRFRNVQRVENPVAVITMGLPASGKSAMSSGMGRDTAVVLDPDEYRAELPEYQAAVGLKARNAAGMVHEEVSYINDEALSRATQEDPLQPGKMYPLVFDGVGGNAEFYGNLMHTLKAKGYTIQLMYAHVGDSPGLSGKDALKIRSEDRGIRTGRFSRQEQVDALYDKLPQNFAALAKLADSAAVYDTSDLDNPKVLYSHNGGAEEGDPNWHLKQS